MKSNQQNQSGPQQFLNPEEREKCCSQKESDNGNGSQRLECVEQWKILLDDARRAMNKAAAESDRASKAHRNAEAWKAKLKKWKEEAEDVHEKADAVRGWLCEFLMAVERTKTEKTAASVEAVLCLVKSIFDDVNQLLHISTSAEDPKGAIQELKHSIECSDSLDVNKKEKALACIVPFEGQMKVVGGMQGDLLTKLLEILHSANVFVAAVGKSGSVNNSALQGQLQDLQRRITGETVYTARQRKCGDDEPAQSTQPILPCGNEIINPADSLFPICEKAYYVNVKALYNDAEEKTKETKSSMKAKREELESASVYFNGLNDAIKASEAAKLATK